MKNIGENLKSLLVLNKLELSENQIFLLSKYIELLLEYNKRINLISRKDEGNIIERHIIPCLIFSTMFQNIEHTVLDIGTGGGLPGIPFAILNQNSLVTLIDSINKKIKAVKEIVQNVGLENIETDWTRAEDKNFIKKNKNKFDLIISRATEDLETLIKYSSPLIKNEFSKLAVIKGGERLNQEIIKAKKRFNYIAIQKIPLIYLPENPGNINQKFTIIVERINARR